MGHSDDVKAVIPESFLSDHEVQWPLLGPALFLDLRGGTTIPIQNRSNGTRFHTASVLSGFRTKRGVAISAAENTRVAAPWHSRFCAGVMLTFVVSVRRANIGTLLTVQVAAKERRVS